MELKVDWTPDCQGKQDFEVSMVRVSARYYPPRPGHRAPATVVAKLHLHEDEWLTAASFEGATEAEAKAKFEAWANERFKEVTSMVFKTFR